MQFPEKKCAKRPNRLSVAGLRQGIKVCVVNESRYEASIGAKKLLLEVLRKGELIRQADCSKFALLTLNYPTIVNGMSRTRRKNFFIYQFAASVSHEFMKHPG
jgi:hypothetical protein